jgi:hypothetical protein
MPMFLKKITAQAHARGISRSEMILFFLKKSMEDVSEPGQLGRLVRYQGRGRSIDYHPFHIRLREDDYEYLLDLRKLLKMSVSLILAESVRRFLRGKRERFNWIWEKYKGDKNRFRNYVIIKELINDVICWRFFWGFPPDIGRYLQKELKINF